MKIRLKSFTWFFLHYMFKGIHDFIVAAPNKLNNSIFLISGTIKAMFCRS